MNQETSFKKVKPPFYFNVVKGYIYDKRLFWAGVSLLIFVMIYIFYINHWNMGQNFYFKCEDPRGCKNTVLESKAYNLFTGHEYKCLEEWCLKDKLPIGEYGTKEPNYFKFFQLLSVFIVLLMLGLNHLIHNRGKKWVFPSALSEETTEKLKKMMGKIED